MKTNNNIKKFPKNIPSLDLLIKRNNNFKENFKKNQIFKLMDTGYFCLEGKREKFLSYFQVWSNYFQKAMLLRTALCDDPNFIPIFYQHLTEEFGHDRMFNKERSAVNVRKDAILEALCNWFLSKMLSFSPYEQVVVMNLCLEAAAVVFYGRARSIIDPDDQFEHFQAHHEVDVAHEEMGLSLLKNLPALQYERLFKVQEDAWAMCEALIHRLSELVQENALSQRVKFESF